MQSLKIPCSRASSRPIFLRFFSRKTPDYYRFVQFCKVSDVNTRRVGVQMGEAGDVIDLSENGFPSALINCLRIDDFMNITSKLVNKGKHVVSSYEACLLAPITNPDKIICVGANYADYCTASNIPVPACPTVFSKFPSTIIGPRDVIRLPKLSEQVDWETELAVVIGKRCKNVSIKDAPDYIFGYTLAQDITARDWNARNGGQFVLGKSMDTFCPLGPAIVSKDHVNVERLQIGCILNGKVKQNGTTADLIFNIDYLISYLSKVMTLLPGDIILTGTPQGVAVHSRPARFLKCGDVLKSKLENIGEMVHMVQ